MFAASAETATWSASDDSVGNAPKGSASAVIFGAVVAAMVEGCEVASTFAGSADGVSGGGLTTLSFVSEARGEFCGENVGNAAANFAISAGGVAASGVIDEITASVDESSIVVWICGAFETSAAGLADCEEAATPSGSEVLPVKDAGVSAN